MNIKAFWRICALIGALLFAACAPDEPPGSQQPGANAAAPPTPTTAPAHTPASTPATAATETSTPAPEPVSQQWPGWPAITLIETMSGLRNPVDLAHAKDGSGRIYVVEQIGLVQTFDDGGIGQSPFMDIRDRVSCCGERGLLGIAFPADFSSSRTLYVNYTTTDPGSLHTRVSRFRLLPDSHEVDPNTEEILLQFHQPWRNHNGGQIAFGPDGYLWI
ncbi:MAG: PQQ-dependent sugar dehydrogenase, partial [Caldilineaceae bacterium]|nr:PQQ-dependent sugar dehydrogenase [Caldilineaceae bacterium]